VSSFPERHFKEIIDRLAEAEVFEVCFFGGEPFLYPGIYNLGVYGKSKGLKVNFLSNGTLIKPTDIEKVTASFDAGAIALNGIGKVHDESVGAAGAFTKAARTIRLLTKAGFSVGVDALVCRSNLSSLESFLSWISNELPVNFVNLNCYISYYETLPSEILEIREVHQVLKIMDNFAKGPLKGKINFGSPVPYCIFPKEYEYLRRSCSAGWMFAGVDVYGNVKTCPWSSEILGNLLNTPLTDIWQHSKGLEEYRSGSWLDESCNSCSLKSFCMGSCNVTSRDSQHSLPSHWKPFISPIDTPQKATGFDHQ
jgi:radical SAM protein with 4Fe4S-binding SPASM domain